MINITLRAYELAVAKFNPIPIVRYKKDKTCWVFIVHWLVFSLIIDNLKQQKIEDVCYEYVLTRLCDSSAKAKGLMNILKENDYIEVCIEKLEDYIQKNKLGSQEYDENGLHIICDDPDKSYWEQQKIKNKMTQMYYEEKEQKLREEHQKRNGVNV